MFSLRCVAEEGRQSILHGCTAVGGDSSAFQLNVQVVVL